MIPPQGNTDFAVAMERVLDVYRRPYDKAFPVVCMDETPRQLIRETVLQGCPQFERGQPGLSGI